MILLVTNLPFWTGGTGAHRRMEALCAFLARHTTLHVLYLQRLNSEDRARLAEVCPGVTLHPMPSILLLLRKARRRLCGRFRRQAATGFDDAWEDRQASRNLVARLRPQCLIVEYAYLAGVVRDMRRRAPRIRTLLDTHDALSLRHERFAQAKGNGTTPTCTREDEAARLDQFDAILAIQAEEARYFQTLVPGKRVIVAGHPEKARPLVFETHMPVRVLFLGSRTEHNRVALMAFLREVWPAVARRFPDKVVLAVAGRVSEDFQAAELPRSVSVLGHVEDLDALYARTDIVVNPVFAGSGLKIKNVEALCHGKCLVTTPVGAEGFSEHGPAPMAVCDSLESMADTLCELVADEDQRRAWAERAHAYAQSNLSDAVVFEELLTWLREESGLATAAGTLAWTVHWVDGTIVDDEGRPVSLHAGDKPDITLAHEAVDEWARENALPESVFAEADQAIWWGLRFEIVHDLLVRILPYLRYLTAWRNRHGTPEEIVLHGAPDPWWPMLFASVFPDARITQVAPVHAAARARRVRRLSLRLIRAALSAWRLVRLPRTDQRRVLLLQQARYWGPSGDRFWGDMVAALALHGIEAVPLVASHEQFADDGRPILKRPAPTLYLDLLLWRAVATRAFWRKAPVPKRPGKPLTIAGVDLTNLVWETVSQRFQALWRGHHAIRTTMPGLIRRAHAGAMLLLDENGGEAAVKAGALLAGCPAIAVQHGVIHSDHMHYIYPMDMETDSIPLCHVTCLRGPAYRDLLLEKSVYAPHQVALTGALGEETRPAPWRKRGANGDRLRMAVLPAQTHRLLFFTSQDLLYNLLSEPLLSALAAAGTDYFLVIRPHPREHSDAYWHAAIQRYGVEDRAIVRRDGDLHDWLDACDMHLSGSSTALEEAVLAGRPNVVVGAAMLGDWLGVLEAGLAVGLEACGSLDAVWAAWERPEAEIAKARERYLDRRTMVDANPADIIARIVLNAIDR